MGPKRDRDAAGSSRAGGAGAVKDTASSPGAGARGKDAAGKGGGSGSGKGALSALGLSVGESESEKAAQVEHIEQAAMEERDAQRETVEEADALVAERDSAVETAVVEEAGTASEDAAASGTVEAASGNAVAGAVGTDAAEAEPVTAAGEGLAESMTAGADAVENADAGADVVEAAAPAAAGGKGKMSKRSLLSTIIICIAIPVVVALGVAFEDSNFYITSLIIIVLTMLPFFIRFEDRRPQARELVVIAVMIAIAAASRAAFIWAPMFSPLIGIAIITAIALGPEQGFITGALAAFISNFLFGQGPWTPWQMFAYGIGAFLAGVLYRKGILKTTRPALFAYGFFVILLFVGPILDTCTVFTITAYAQSMESVLSIYVAGISYNIAHGLATAITMAVLTKPLCEKLERIKVKYGMEEGWGVER